MTNKYYVYEHWRPDKDECFYVGKGKGYRVSILNNRSEHHKRVVKKLARLGMCLEVRMFKSELSEDEAYQVEIERIAFWRAAGVKIINKTAGGEGLKNPTEDTREKMRKAHLTRWSDEARKAVSDKIKDMWNRDGFRENYSEKRKGYKPSAETIEKRAAALRGRKQSPESIAKKIGPNNPFYGKRHPPEILAKIAEKNRGSKMSEETRAKMRESQRLRRENEPKKPKPPKIFKEKVPYRHSPESIEKLKIAAKKRGVSDVCRTAQKAAVTGKKRPPFSDETRAKMSAASVAREARKRLERVPT